MDVVWMGQFFKNWNIKKNKGQSLVEYILLLAVITSFGVAVIRGKRFKDFLAGKQGLFATMKIGMAYSYLYGQEYNSNIVFDPTAPFDYSTKNHDSYFNKTKNKTHFFVNIKPYP
jgi:hypothetical protein